MKNQQVYDKHFSRLILEGMVKSLIYAAIAAFSLSFLVGVVAWLVNFNPLTLSAKVFIFILQIVSPILYIKKFRPNQAQIIERLDGLGLEERTLTMHEFTFSDSVAAQTQRNDAKEQICKLSPKLIKLKISALSIAILVLTGLAGVGINVFAAVNAVRYEPRHDYGAWIVIKQPTCIEEGIEIRLCNDHNGHSQIRYIPISNEHDFGEFVVTLEPTENTMGEETSYCSHNANHKKTRTIPAIGTSGLLFAPVEDGYSVALGNAQSKDIYIPDTYNGMPVTRIALNGFSDSDIKSVRFPQWLTSVSQQAFSGCTNLKSIVIPQNVSLISHRAFKGCTSLESVVISESVTAINGGAFSGCINLKSVTFNQGSLLQYLGLGSEGAFKGCTSLNSINIPPSVKALGDSLFLDCSSLTSITIPDDITVVPVQAFSGCVGLTSIDIPLSITRIASRAFFNCVGLSRVYYRNGSNEFWKRIQIDESNESLLEAQLHYF